MFKKGMRVLFAAAAALPLIASTAWAEGLMTIIVNDPSNPYWFTEGEVAKKTAEGLGYKAVVGGHKGDTNTESNLIAAARLPGWSKNKQPPARLFAASRLRKLLWPKARCGSRI